MIISILKKLYILVAIIYAGTSLAASLPNTPGEAIIDEDAAFIFSVNIDGRQLNFNWQIAPNHYLYKDQIKIINSDNEPVFTSNKFPAGKIINDDIIGEYSVYADQLDLSIPWSDALLDSSFLVRYQGCQVKSFCYLPVTKLVHINNNKQITIEDSFLQQFEVQSPTDKLAQTISQRFLPLTLLIFFGLGLLLSLSPCVLPMIPLVVNLIVGQKPISQHKALVLSSSYVLGMAGSYSLAGVAAGMLGSTLQLWLQQPLVLIVMTIFVLVLALSQFDLIHISLPHFNKRLHHWGQKQIKGSVIGAFMLGIIAALIVSPCITAPLIGVLTYIGQHGNPWIGGLTLFSLGLGMGAPLIVVALLSNVILPAAGAWMNLIKSITGVALLGLAIWILERVIPQEFTLILWGALCIFAAVLLKAFEPLKHAKLANQLLKAIGILLAIYGAVLILGAVNKQFNLLSHTTEKATAQRSLNWQQINSVANLDKYLALAKQSNKYTLVEVYADWCTSCQKIEQEIFNNPVVQAKLTNYMLLKIDMTNMNPNEQELLQTLQIYGPPVIIFYDLNGQELKAKRVTGEISAHEFLELID